MPSYGSDSEIYHFQARPTAEAVWVTAARVAGRWVTKAAGRVAFRAALRAGTSPGRAITSVTWCQPLLSKFKSTYFLERG